MPSQPEVRRDSHPGGRSVGSPGEDLEGTGSGIDGIPFMAWLIQFPDVLDSKYEVLKVERLPASGFVIVCG